MSTSYRTGFISLILAFTFAKNAYSQGLVSFPSANAASLGKHIDQPVSEFTGIPNISIPLYEIQDQDFFMPITLNYHATAFNANEHPGLAISIILADLESPRLMDYVMNLGKVG